VCVFPVICCVVHCPVTLDFFQQVNAIGESMAKESLAQSANDLLRNTGSAAAGLLTEGNSLEKQGAKSKRILTLLGGRNNLQAKKIAAKFQPKKIAESVKNADLQSAKKSKTLFEKFGNKKILGKMGGLLGKLQLKMPIHLIDSMITYAIGVVSGMQDMAQVRILYVDLFMTTTHFTNF
jgi:hypothetical protein